MSGHRAYTYKALNLLVKEEIRASDEQTTEAWGKTVSHLLRQGQIRNPKTGRDVGTALSALSDVVAKSTLDFYCGEVLAWEIQGDHPPITPMKAAPRDEFSKGNLAIQSHLSSTQKILQDVTKFMIFWIYVKNLTIIWSVAFCVFYSGSEWRLYDYITRHFISSLMPDVEYEEKDRNMHWHFLAHLDNSWQSVILLPSQALIVNIAGEDFCYTYHEMRERPYMSWMLFMSGIKAEVCLQSISFSLIVLYPASWDMS